MALVPMREWRDLARLPVVRQGARFILTGSTVMVVYLGVTSVLSAVLGMPFEAALAIGYACGLCVHFTGQRFFVWRHDAGYALDFRSQLTRYLCVALTQYGITALVTAELPQRIGVSEEVVYVPTAGVLTILTFLLFRTSIFHHAGGTAEPIVDPMTPPTITSGSAGDLRATGSGAGALARKS